jgi:hypothetical protein
VAGVRLHGKRHVVERAEVAIDAGDLERAREALARALRRRQAGDVLAREADVPRVGPQVARELADERGLACAVRPDDGVRLALAHLEAHAVGGGKRAEGLAQFERLEDRVRHLCRPRAAGRQVRA